MELVTLHLSEFCAAVSVPADLQKAFVFMNRMAVLLQLKLNIQPEGLIINLVDSRGNVYDEAAIDALQTVATKLHPVAQFARIWKLSGHYKKFTEFQNKK
jgi:hypothetical protein